jgi:hypothetical protein
MSMNKTWAISSSISFLISAGIFVGHGEHRWTVKNDPSTLPVDASAIQAVTPDA